MATKRVIEPIFEADFRPVPYGFRPKRGATGALETIRVTANQGHEHVVDVATSRTTVAASTTTG